MEKNKRKLKNLFTFLVMGMGIFVSGITKANGSPIYYDSFYEDYYRAYPNAKPVQKPQKVQTQQPVYYNGYDPYTQYQVSANYNLNIGSVERPSKGWEIEVQRKQSYPHFMFAMDVGSILEWDEIDAHETVFKVSRDFMIKNRQYVFNLTYGTGSGTTSRTSDDDIFNEAHLISLGAGNVDLSNFSVSLGMRNIWRLGNWDITPYIGYRKRETHLHTHNHQPTHPVFQYKNNQDRTEQEPHDHA